MYDWHVAQTSTITCPHCKRSSTETMPEDACVFFYECPHCKTLLRPLAGHCCVFCSFGDHQCPPRPTLVTADVGVAIGAGTDVAVEAGDIVLRRSDPRDIPRIIALSRASYRKIIQNQ
jgi:hypothetical protein